MRRVMCFLNIACLCIILTVSASAAYIDPSAVTYTAQAVAAVIVALGAVITVFRHKIAAIFKRGKNETVKREIHVIDDVHEEDDNGIRQAPSESSTQENK